MCYNLEYHAKRLIMEAEKIGIPKQQVEQLREYLKKQQANSSQDLYNANGMTHPSLLVISNDKSQYIQEMEWGLIPNWVNNTELANDIRNKTINARGESIFEKASFKSSAKYRRCVIVADSFFEHHHKFGKKFPYNIRRKDESPMLIAGLWDEWNDFDSGEIRRTFSIVTCEANSLLEEIHNNPKHSDARMPVLLESNEANTWLKDIHNPHDKKDILDLIKSYPSEKLDAYTVQRLLGHQSLGNGPEVIKEHKYSELEDGEQGSLF